MVVEVGAGGATLEIVDVELRPRVRGEAGEGIIVLAFVSLRSLYQ